MCGTHFGGQLLHLPRAQAAAEAKAVGAPRRYRTQLCNDGAGIIGDGVREVEEADAAQAMVEAEATMKGEEAAAAAPVGSGGGTP